jgi:hypothetical protein
MIKQLYSFILLMILAWPVLARQVDGLYDVVVPVTSQSQAELKQASVQGLKTVLIRVSGSADVTKQRAILQALKRTSSFMKQYSYDYQPSSEGEAEKMVAFIEFEQQLVDQLLRDSGLPLWSSYRPTVLVWMVVEDSEGRRFVSRERDPEIVDAIELSANRRGLALMLPDLDLEDMIALSVDDLWQLNPFKAKPALERYKADTVLLGKVTKLTNGEWLGRWHYGYGQQDLTFDGEALSPNEYVALALNQVAEVLAEKYAVAPVNIAENGLLMRISGIVNFVDYARVVNYLESLSAIHHANVVYIDGDSIIVRLIADGLLSQLQQSIALAKRLTPIPDSTDYEQSEYRIDLHYSWPSTFVDETIDNSIGSN